jgi:hypothetical protein
MVTALDLQNQYNQNHSAKGGRSAAADAGRIKIVLNRQLNRRVVMGVASYELVSMNGPAVALGLISEAQVATDMTLLDSLAMAHQTDVKRDARWQRLYHYDQRNFKFMNAAGGIVRQSLWSYPCHYCGIVLPEQFVEVDHRQPQAHPGVAVLKVIHSIGAGYTSAAGHGTKGTQAAAIGAIQVGPLPMPHVTANAIGALNPVPVNGWNWATAWQGGNAVVTATVAKQNRYTITDAGRTFLSLCNMFWGQRATEQKCLNAILNLVPACRACNGAGGKGSRTHARQ